MRAVVEVNTLFRDVPRPALGTIVSASRVRRFAADQLVCALGAVPGTVWIVAEGALCYSNVSETGQESIVGVLGPGAVVGLACFTDGKGMHSDVRAHGATTLVEIPCTALEALVERHPRVWKTIAAFAFRRMRILVEVRRAFEQSALRSRVCWQLLSHSTLQARAAARGRDLVVPLSQSVLAKIVGASRPKVNRVLKDLEKVGLIRVGYGEVTLRAPHRLQEEAHGEMLSVLPAREPGG